MHVNQACRRIIGLNLLNLQPGIYRYTWHKSTQTFRRATISEDKVGTGLIIRVADLNSDNKKDLIMAGKTGTYILWQE